MFLAQIDVVVGIIYAVGLGLFFGLVLALVFTWTKL